MKDFAKFLVFSLLVAVAAFLLFGIPTALVPTGLYGRMTQPTIIDYAILTIVSLLIGANSAVFLYKNTGCRKEKTATIGSGALGFLAVGCPTCNAILVSLFSASALMVFFDPVRPLIGAASIAILAMALFSSTKNLGRKNKCDNSTAK